MQPTWAMHAQAVIDRVLSQMPGANLAEKRRALHDAYPYGQRRHWPYKVWCRQVRISLGLATPGKTLGRLTQALAGTPLFDACVTSDG